ncbi:MAG TPA: hypothetical protein DHW34_07460, partial [Actinobacteria bacterium]|nr:hypothetical protein [Actinomycetota bacterium]
MRRRLIGIVVTTVLVTALILGAALAVYASLGIRQRSAALAKEDAVNIASLISARLKLGEAVGRNALQPYLLAENPSTVVVTMPDGSSMTFGQQPSGPIVSASSVRQGVAVRITEPVGIVISQQKILQRFTILIVLSVLVAFAIAYWRSRRFIAVFQSLAFDAARIGAGDMRPARRYGMAEVDEIADALDASAGRVANLITQERESVRDVAHQLRTPLTAIELRLDEVIDAADRRDFAAARGGVSAAQEQMDRLNGVIDDLLTARHGPQPTETVCVGKLLRQLDSEWAPILRHTNRTLRWTCAGGMHVQGAEGPLRQIVGTLFDNAVVHGQGTVSVTVERDQGLIALRIADEGDSIDAQSQVAIFSRAVSGAQRSGLGLAVARSLAEYLGGRLELVSTHPTEFALYLNAVPADEVLEAP